MRMIKLVSICAASAMTLALFDATIAEAAPRGMSSRMVSKPRVSVKPTTKMRTKVVTTKKVTVSKKVATSKVPNLQKKVLAKNLTPKFAPKGNLKLGKVNLKNLPVQKVSGNKFVNVPKNIKPKLTLTLAPKGKFKNSMSPFVQKHWKKAFFWVAIAGVGYVTIPQLYYDRFYTCVDVDDPDYDDCGRLLSYAAIEEEEVVRVRTPMPPSAAYRYEAKATPPPALIQPIKEVADKDVAEASPQQGGVACTLSPFVERKWNRAYVWVKVPELGNVTVPEDYYDRFYSQVSAEPANYVGACQVLIDAAAADMMATSSADMRSGTFQ